MNEVLSISRAMLRMRRTRGYSPEYIVHQLVADLFPDGPERPYLYRVTRTRPGGAEVLVLSTERPRDADRIPVRDWGTALDVETKPYAPSLASGSVLDYEIRINATRVVTHEDGRKKRTDVWDAVFAANRDDPRSPADVYGAYLERKLDGVAELFDARVTERGQVRARRADRNAPITFIATNLIGTLRVQRPEPFLELVGGGIGRAKAFGCGLLCLSRPGTVLPRRYASAEER